MAQVVIPDTVNGDAATSSAAEPLICMQLFSEDNDHVNKFGPPLTNTVSDGSHPEGTRHLVNALSDTCLTSC